MDDLHNLSQLKPGQWATVKYLTAAGSMRRRFLDLGLVEHTKVQCLGKSPLGDPGAYLIRGTVIAIRAKDAQDIIVETDPFPKAPTHRTIALAGNPNVGKSTIFNSLTGMRQHTGNWPGKTVSSARGTYQYQGETYTLVDIPGTYSLKAHSAEEEAARDFLCLEAPDAVVVVCDASCLERNLNLVLQIMEITSRIIVCVNLMDEASRKGIRINTDLLSRRLHVPVVGTSARNRKSLDVLQKAIEQTVHKESPEDPFTVSYPKPVEDAVGLLIPVLMKQTDDPLLARRLGLRLLEQDFLPEFTEISSPEDNMIRQALKKADTLLREQNIHKETLPDLIATALITTAESVCTGVVKSSRQTCPSMDQKLDQVLTGRKYGYCSMLLLLAFLLWLTIVGANYPSRALSAFLFHILDLLSQLFVFLHVPKLLHDVCILGIFKVAAWVVAVMLPPMAIFFPLFTLLEDVGYLPRIAYNLDRPFQCCRACGKQSLTMCMGFGCNAAGVTGCRIIDSPRERLLAVLTNSFVPCNGKFPTLIALLAIFFSGTGTGITSSLLSAFLLTLIILLGIVMTFAVTRLLSATLLKGMPSSFTLELPPYRRPQIGTVLVRSVFDRTLFVLGRAVAVAAPAGFLIWCMANICIGGSSLLTVFASLLEPLGHLMGLDGVILTAFILGFPANEIVMPIILMAYLSQGSLMDMSDLTQMRLLLTAHGWTLVTAINFMLFSLMHWPCSTTLLTIRKETRSWQWTFLAALLPTAAGMLACILFTAIYKGICHIFFL